MNASEGKNRKKRQGGKKGPFGGRKGLHGPLKLRIKALQETLSSFQGEGVLPAPSYCCHATFMDLRHLAIHSTYKGYLVLAGFKTISEPAVDTVIPTITGQRAVLVSRIGLSIL